MSAGALPRISLRLRERLFAASAVAVVIMAAAPLSSAQQPTSAPSEQSTPTAASAPTAPSAPTAASAPSAPTETKRTGKHCLEQPDAKIQLSQTLGGQINPLGLENQLALSICMPFTRKHGVLFDFTNVEVGLVNYLSPVYDHMGGYVSVTPLSIMKLRAEVTGFGIWPIQLRGGGYYGHTSYDADFSEDTHPKGQGGTATGTVVAFSAVLQGKVPLPRGSAILVSDTLLLEQWTAGDKPYWYNSRRDLLVARSDWTLKNTALLVAEIPITDNISVRAGLADDVSMVPRSGYASNITAAIGTVMVKRIGGTIRFFQPFLRAGIYTEHASSTEFRKGEPHFLAGINTFYDLATIESD